MAKKRVYWDANCFLGVFRNEPDKVQLCKGTIANAENGKLVIVTSAITLTEVIKLKGSPRLPKADEDKIADYFKHNYISIRNVDRFVAEYARRLMWRRAGLWPKDSIHVATAILNKVKTMHTFDDELLKLDNKYGSPKLHICKPDIEYQMNFEDLSEQDETE